MAAGSIFVDNTTASAEVARELAAAGKERGIAFIDAPVSGGQAGAGNGTLTVMCGGEPEPFERARPVIDTFPRPVPLLGPSGAGQLTKMVNQICLPGLLHGLAQGINLGQRAGLAMAQVIAVL